MQVVDKLESSYAYDFKINEEDYFFLKKIQHILLCTLFVILFVLNFKI